MDAGAWWAAIYGVAQSRTRLKRLSSSSSRQKYSSSFLKWKRQKQNLFPRMGMEPWGGFRVVVVGGMVQVPSALCTYWTTFHPCRQVDVGPGGQPPAPAFLPTGRKG